MNERMLATVEMTSRAVQALRKVAEQRGIKPEIIISKARHHDIAHARQAVFVRLWAQDMSLQQIGRAFDVHHTTVHFGIRAEVQRMLDLLEASE